jgi:hypothetical protein
MAEYRVGMDQRGIGPKRGLKEQGPGTGAISGIGAQRRLTLPDQSAAGGKSLFPADTRRSHMFLLGISSREDDLYRNTVS